MDLDGCIQQLAARLPCLPGSRAQEHMAPRLRGGVLPRVLASAPRRAAALAVLFQKPAPGDGAYLLLTRRTQEVERHKGQVCLPGGALHPGESLLAAALRETAEEVGLDPSSLRVLGPLTPVDVPVSGFRIHPFVGVLDGELSCRPDPREVAELLFLPVSTLWAPSSRRWRRDRRHAEWMDVPFFHHEGTEVWGATAMVLSELAEVLHPGAGEQLRGR